MQVVRGYKLPEEATGLSVFFTVLYICKGKRKVIKSNTSSQLMTKISVKSQELRAGKRKNGNENDPETDPERCFACVCGFQLISLITTRQMFGEGGE